LSKEIYCLQKQEIVCSIIAHKSIITWGNFYQHFIKKKDRKNEVKTDFYNRLFSGAFRASRTLMIKLLIISQLVLHDATESTNN